MKSILTKWSIRITATLVLIGGLLVGIVLNPSLLYADATIVDNYTIYHNSEIDDDFLNQLKNVTALLESSELYDSSFKLDLCLNDGSFYPTIIQKIRGQAFAWGFFDKIVLQGNASYEDNTVELNGYHWNLKQLITHEAVHCYQYNKLGFWGSNPIANYPNWKWEGYPEFVARQSRDKQDLFACIDHLNRSEGAKSGSWDVELSDGTISPVNYYKDWLLVKYCLDVKKASYEKLLNEPANKDTVQKDMMIWYENERLKRPQ